ncbi:MAG: hypothetical protein OHK0032_09300 [Thermodesulfovibrionales bacterium]
MAAGLFATLKEDVSRTPGENSFQEFLEMLYCERGWDFRNYKKSSLMRRIALRLNACNISSYNDYYRLLRSDPSEYGRLFSTITIKVSEFFREPWVFEFLREIIISRFSGTEGLRAWCCGCASGDEAYSLGILFAECLTPTALKGAKIFATDIDSNAIDAARRAIYREGSIKNVSDERRARYFISTDKGYKVRYDIRNILRFGILDIVRDPPISKIDILLCRNLLIYFEKDLQTKVIEKLHYALNPNGIVVLGRAEVLPAQFASCYEEIGDRTRIYIKRISQ